MKRDGFALIYVKISHKNKIVIFFAIRSKKRGRECYQ